MCGKTYRLKIKSGPTNVCLDSNFIMARQILILLTTNVDFGDTECYAKE